LFAAALVGQLSEKRQTRVGEVDRAVRERYFNALAVKSALKPAQVFASDFPLNPSTRIRTIRLAWNNSTCQSKSLNVWEIASIGSSELLDLVLLL
jgi:hypothetical protein